MSNFIVLTSKLMSNNICAYKPPQLGDKTLEQCHSTIPSTSIMNNMVGWLVLLFYLYIYTHTTSGLIYLKNENVNMCKWEC
jgi:hypothetical protein